MLSVEKIDLRYNSVPVIRDVTFRVDKGEIVALIGGNGNGKSTILKGISGILHPGTGSKMLYSADGARAALITPGDGAWLFDAETGKILGRWTEDQMPRRPTPHAPSSLTLP